MRLNLQKQEDLVIEPLKPQLLSEQQFNEKKTILIQLHKEQNKRCRRRKKLMEQREEVFR